MGENFVRTGPHGLAWAVCFDLLYYLIVGEYCRTEYQVYHPKNEVGIAVIEKALDDGIERVDGLPRTGTAVQKGAFLAVVSECVRAAQVEFPGDEPEAIIGMDDEES